MKRYIRPEKKEVVANRFEDNQNPDTMTWDRGWAERRRGGEAMLEADEWARSQDSGWFED